MPAEIRQHIIANSLRIELKKEPQFVNHSHDTERHRGKHRVITSFSCVCRLLQADLTELRKVWLPSATTNTLVIDGDGLYAFDALNQEFEQLAEAIDNPWAGIQTVHFQYFKDTTPQERRKSAFKLAPKFTIDVNNFGNYRTNELLLRSVKTIVVDLAMPPKPLKSLESRWPVDGADGKPVRLEQRVQQVAFWHHVMARMLLNFAYLWWDAKGIHNRGLRKVLEKPPVTVELAGKREVIFETCGTLPRSQVDVLGEGMDPDSWAEEETPRLVLHEYMREVRARWEARRYVERELNAEESRETDLPDGPHGRRIKMAVVQGKRN